MQYVLRIKLIILKNSSNLFGIYLQILKRRDRIKYIMNNFVLFVREFSVLKRLFTVFNCIIVLMAFIIGGMISRYEKQFGILTVKAPEIVKEEKVVPATGEVSGKINLNTATAEELDTLDGIGEKLSRRIILWREANGSFNVIEDIMKVSGIGKSLFDSIKDEICVN